MPIGRRKGFGGGRLTTTVGLLGGGLGGGLFGGGSGGGDGILEVGHAGAGAAGKGASGADARALVLQVRPTMGSALVLQLHLQLRAHQLHEYPSRESPAEAFDCEKQVMNRNDSPLWII